MTIQRVKLSRMKRVLQTATVDVEAETNKGARESALHRAGNGDVEWHSQPQETSNVRVDEIIELATGDEELPSE